jgi:hypothetical protein
MVSIAHFRNDVYYYNTRNLEIDLFFFLALSAAVWVQNVPFFFTVHFSFVISYFFLFSENNRRERVE